MKDLSSSELHLILYSLDTVSKKMKDCEDFIPLRIKVEKALKKAERYNQILLVQTQRSINQYLKAIQDEMNKSYVDEDHITLTKIGLQKLRILESALLNGDLPHLHGFMT